MALLQWPCMGTNLERPSPRVHLPQNRPFLEKQRLPRIQHDIVEVVLPVLLMSGEVEQVIHDFLGVPVFGVGEEEHFRSGLPHSREQHGKPVILDHVLGQVLHSLPL